MKRLFLLSVALLICICASAKETKRDYRYGKKGYFGTATVGYVAPGKGVGIDVVNGYAFNPWFMLGGGLGIRYTNPKGHYHISIPAYVHLRANFLDRRVTPFFALNVGGGLGLGYLSSGPSLDKPDQTDARYFFTFGEPQLGIAVRLKNGRMVDLGVGPFLEIGEGLHAGVKIGVGFTW